MAAKGPCSICGQLMNIGRGSLPPERRRCRPCRRATWTYRDCECCGAQFPVSANRIATCSTQCATAMRSRRDLAPWHGRSCEVCGKTYDATHKQQRTCGRECGAVLNFRERPVSLKRKRPKWSGPGLSSRVWFPHCLQCGRAFAARVAGVKVCSNDCRNARRVEGDRAYNKLRRPPKEHTCGDCGTGVPTTRQKCDPCLRESKRRRKERSKRRRRALKKGVATEPYTLAEIAARDRNVCQLCRKRVAMTKQVPHPKAPVVDHVLPLACGGDDTRANTQLAHFLCNSIKSDGGSQQLALVG